MVNAYKASFVAASPVNVAIKTAACAKYDALGRMNCKATKIVFG